MNGDKMFQVELSSDEVDRLDRAVSRIFNKDESIPPADQDHETDRFHLIRQAVIYVLDRTLETEKPPFTLSRKFVRRSA